MAATACLCGVCVDRMLFANWSGRVSTGGHEANITHNTRQPQTNIHHVRRRGMSARRGRMANTRIKHGEHGFVICYSCCMHLAKHTSSHMPINQVATTPPPQLYRLLAMYDMHYYSILSPRLPGFHHQRSGSRESHHDMLCDFVLCACFQCAQHIHTTMYAIRKTQSHNPSSINGDERRRNVLCVCTNTMNSSSRTHG